MTENDEENRGEEILNILQKGTEFTNEILKENERLRFRVAQLEEANSAFAETTDDEALKAEFSKLREKLDLLADEKSKLLDKYNAVEEENKDFVNRYIEIENENNVLANLYVSSYQLHSTLDFEEVLRVILEIVINLVGAEEFSIYLLDEKTHKLTAVAAEGLDETTLPVIDIGEGVIGGSVKDGDNYFAQSLVVGETANYLSPLVSIPMKIKERVIGTIVIYKLLQQKEEFTNLDHELFTLLAGHTATAIFSSKLYSESERKLSTMQGFINLMTNK
ncbi:MAG: GAF domain-containing protein [Deltaproteobacteria bacterium]|nr:GAF domain-containing protein [Deltaproteobacteria bacterium]